MLEKAAFERPRGGRFRELSLVAASDLGCVAIRRRQSPIAMIEWGKALPPRTLEASQAWRRWADSARLSLRREVTLCREKTLSTKSRSTPTRSALPAARVFN